jgi:hypothetical protein
MESLSRMVSTAELGGPSATPTGLLRVRFTVSPASITRSSFIGIVNVFAVRSPAAHVRVPETAV